MKTGLNGNLCSINTKLIYRTNISPVHKLIWEATKCMKPRSDDCYSPGYLPTGTEFLYANRRGGLKSLIFSSYNTNISSAKRFHCRLSYQLTLYSYCMAMIVIM